VLGTSVIEVPPFSYVQHSVASPAWTRVTGFSIFAHLMSGLNDDASHRHRSANHAPLVRD